MSETGYVYTLSDPETDEPKYVGATKDPHERLYGHLGGNTNNEVEEWVGELEEDGQTPVMNLIRVAPLDELSKHEEEIIRQLMDEWDLLNKDTFSNYSPKGETAQKQRKEAYLNRETVLKVQEIAETRGTSVSDIIRNAVQKELADAEEL